MRKLLCKTFTKRHLKIMLLCKREGNSDVISNLILFATTVCAIAMILLLHTSWLSNFNKMDDAELVARKYILKMESKGYLTDTDELSLIEDLKALDIKNIVFDISTTKNKVENGETVILKFTCDIKLKHYKILSSLEFADDNNTDYDYANKLFSKSSTAIN